MPFRTISVLPVTRNGWDKEQNHFEYFGHVHVHLFDEYSFISCDFGSYVAPKKVSITFDER